MFYLKNYEENVSIFSNKKLIHTSDVNAVLEMIRGNIW